MNDTSTTVNNFLGRSDDEEIGFNIVHEAWGMISTANAPNNQKDFKFWIEARMIVRNELAFGTLASSIEAVAFAIRTYSRIGIID